MRKLVISGVSSFMGYHLAKSFAHDFQVVGTHSRPLEEYTDVELERLTRLRDIIQLRLLNLEDHDSIEVIVEDEKPLYFIHHAGYATQYGSFDYDLEKSLDINVLPLRRLFQSLKKCGCEGVLVSGTSMEYSDGEMPHTEDEACFPSTPYGISKLAETTRAIQLSQEFQIPTRVIRIFNPFGDLEAPKKLLPYLMEQLNQGSEVELSPCTQIRNFDHTDEVCRIYRHMLGTLSQGGADIVNGSSKLGVPLAEYLELICEFLGKDKNLLKFGRKEMRATEVMRLESSPAKLLQSGFEASNLREEVEKFCRDYLSLSDN